MEFKDKTVVITGGSEGVGAATARAFASVGANLLLVARNKRKLETIAEELRGKTRVEIFVMDVADADACATLLKKAQFEFGSIHVLVNNAGYHKRGRVENINAADLGQMIDINLKAPIILCRLVLPYIRQSGGGAIINVGSLAGRAPVPGMAAYSASKFGLRAFTFALADEVADENLKLAVVSPGPIDTGFIMDSLDAAVDLNFSQPISTADEVAREILILCSNSKRERSMPPISGLLATLTYLFPWIGRIVRPLLEQKGRAVKRRLIAEKHRKIRHDAR
ncbi:MAG: SDR family NAD(P)-dependent oxidoreductase [Proteobacteria bacterium]|nr:SDR family NAD(P)-dependent oxidoreductase [Pseudomonadota bacterium]MDA0994090.1 SDR family NAD(P)-dependent oxidoreductase [Pseudomonadota bacterium]